MNNEFKDKYIVIIVIILLSAGAFYWFGYRPTKIRKNCDSSAKAIVKDHTTRTKPSFMTKGVYYDEVESGYDYDTVYKKCLREIGFE